MRCGFGSSLTIGHPPLFLNQIVVHDGDVSCRATEANPSSAVHLERLCTGIRQPQEVCRPCGVHARERPQPSRQAIGELGELRVRTIPQSAGGIGSQVSQINSALYYGAECDTAAGRAIDHTGQEVYVQTATAPISQHLGG